MLKCIPEVGWQAKPESLECLKKKAKKPNKDKHDENENNSNPDPNL